MKVKFGVFADMHIDIMHDCEERLAIFLEECRKENVDFIIHLGDFVYPSNGLKCTCKPERTPANVKDALENPCYVNKDKMLEMYNGFEKPAYHVLGNHDCDMCTKEQMLAYTGAPGNYYSFDCGGFHFVALDSNNMKLNGEFVSYANGNYFDQNGGTGIFPYLTDPQLEWLEKDLQQAKGPAILFSHYRLCKGNYCVYDQEKLREIIAKAPHGVMMGINGHDHTDTLFKVDNTWFWGVNSMSNCWLGTKFVCEGRYGKEIDEKFKSIRYVAPYKDPVYAIVTLDENGASIKGTKSDYVGPSPEEMGVYAEGSKFVESNIKITAEILDRELPWKK